MTGHDAGELLRAMTIVSVALVAASLVGCADDDGAARTVTDVAADSIEGDTSPNDTATDDPGDDSGGEDADAAETDAGADTGTDDTAGDGGDDAADDAGEPDADVAGEVDTGPGDMADLDLDVADTAPDVGGPLCEGGSEAAETEPTPNVLVTTLTDVVADDGLLSLREAIGMLNAGGTGDVIGFEPSLSGTITLGSNLSIDESVTIVGHDENGDGAPDISVHYETNGTLFLMSATADQSYRLRWLGISGARNPIYLLQQAGGFSLTVEHCEFTDQALPGGADAAVWIEGNIDNPTPFSLVVRHSYFHDVDSGVFVNGGSHDEEHSVIIDGCVFEDAANEGAAITLSWLSEATVSNTIVAGSADSTYVSLHQVPDARIINSTIVGTSEVPRLTHRDASVTANNVVLSGPGPDCTINVSSNDVVANYSLITETDGCEFVGVGNILGTVGSSVDPMLQTLGDYGGGRQSMPPAAGSPLIDAGSDDLALGGDGPLADDVRGFGFPRRCDGDDDETLTVDIGATELQ